MLEQREAMLLRLPPKLKADVSELARVNKRSTTREIELAIEQHIAAAPRSPVQAEHSI
jgi:predicted transcriptional regulator